jgi:hypothetical protein
MTTETRPPHARSSASRSPPRSVTLPASHHPFGSTPQPPRAAAVYSSPSVAAPAEPRAQLAITRTHGKTSPCQPPGPTCPTRPRRPDALAPHDLQPLPAARPVKPPRRWPATTPHHDLCTLAITWSAPSASLPRQQVTTPSYNLSKHCEAPRLHHGAPSGNPLTSSPRSPNVLALSCGPQQLAPASSLDSTAALGEANKAARHPLYQPRARQLKCRVGRRRLATHLCNRHRHRDLLRSPLLRPRRRSHSNRWHDPRSPRQPRHRARKHHGAPSTPTPASEPPHQQRHFLISSARHDLLQHQDHRDTTSPLAILSSRSPPRSVTLPARHHLVGSTPQPPRAAAVYSSPSVAAPSEPRAPLAITCAPGKTSPCQPPGPTCPTPPRRPDALAPYGPGTPASSKIGATSTTSSRDNPTPRPQHPATT